MKEITITEEKYAEIVNRLIDATETLEEEMISTLAYVRLDYLLFHSKTVEEIKKIEKGGKI